MFLNRLMAMVLAVVLTVSCIPCSWAEDATQIQSDPDGGAVAAAAVSDLVYVPGKTGTCILSSILWSLAMTVTAGTCYKDCGNFVHEACAGKWVVKGEDMTDPNKRNLVQ